MVYPSIGHMDVSFELFVLWGVDSLCWLGSPFSLEFSLLPRVMHINLFISSDQSNTLQQMKISQASSWIKMSNYGFKLWLERRSSPKVLIGFDLGLKSTGLSITSSDLKHAYYLTTINGDIASKDFRERITNILLKQKPVGLVLGRPNFVIQAQQTQSVIQAIDEWVKQMSTEHQKTAGLRFTFVDESWTTLTAKAQLIAIQQEIRKWGHLRNEKELIDGMASVAILRKYLQFYNKK